MYGMPGLDYVGASQGEPFVVETKAPGEKPRPLQEVTLERARLAGVKTFIVDGGPGTPSFDTLDAWINRRKDTQDATRQEAA